MKRVGTLLFFSLFSILLNSCATDVMKRMVEDKQSVGVLMIRPEAPIASSGGLQFIGGILTSYEIPIEESLKKRVAKYDNHIKTSMAFGKQIVDRLKSQGVEAHLIQSFPTRDSVSGGGNSILASVGRLSPERFPVERKRYGRYLVIVQTLATGVSEGPSGAQVTPMTTIHSYLHDSASDEKLGIKGLMELGRTSFVSSSGSFNPPLDDANRVTRALFLTKVLNDYKR